MTNRSISRPLLTAGVIVLLLGALITAVGVSMRPADVVAGDACYAGTQRINCVTYQPIAEPNREAAAASARSTMLVGSVVVMAGLAMTLLSMRRRS